MNDASWLAWASMTVWVVLGGYLFLLNRKASSLETRLRRLEYTAGKSAVGGKQRGE